MPEKNIYNGTWFKNLRTFQPTAVGTLSHRTIIGWKNVLLELK